jgi:hypothetical protein
VRRASFCRAPASDSATAADDEATSAIVTHQRSLAPRPGIQTWRRHNEADYLPALRRRKKARSTKDRLASARLIGASVVALSRGRCRRIGVSWGSQVSSEVAGAPCSMVGASAIWSLSGGKRTWRGHLETVAIDRNRRRPVWIRREAGLA